MSLQNFRKNVLTVFFLGCMTFMANGCIYMIVGGVGALGGYVVSPDTVEGIVNHPSDNVYSAAQEVVATMGVIQEQSELGGAMIAKIGGAKVTITAIRMNETTTRLSVKARKNWMPKIRTAQDVYMKIESYVKEEEPVVLGESSDIDNGGAVDLQ